MRKQRYKGYVKQLKDILFAKENKWLPSSLSYYIVLSLIPTLFLIEFALSLFNLPSIEIIQTIANQTKQQQLLKTFLENKSWEDVLAAIIALVLSINVTANGIKAFLAANDRLFDILEVEDKDSELKRRVKSFKITIVFLISIVIFSFISVGLDYLVANTFQAFQGVFSFITTLIFLIIYLLLFFKAAPNCKMTFKAVYPGALVSAGLVIITLLVFNIATTYFIDFNNIYGPLSYIVSLLIVSYFLAYSLFIGLGLNAIRVRYNLKHRSK